MAYMRAGPNLYVQGGKVVRNSKDYSISPQLYALDISTSWTTDSPPWKALTGGPTYNLYNGATSPDNKTLTTLFDQNAQLLVNQYSIETDTWKYNTVAISENLSGSRPVVDPTSGLIYIQGPQNMTVLDPRTVTLVKQLPIANTMMPSRSFPGAVYHPGRKSILYLGGFLPEDEDGSKIIVFGGRIPYDSTPTVTVFTGTLYILDVATATWTEGQASDPRLYMACTIVGDQFIAWGGFDGINTIDGPPIVYSLTTNNWINSYTAPAYYGNKPRPPTGTPGNDSPPSSPNGSDSSSEDSSNLGPILGGTLGSLCVIAFAAVLYLFLKRRADKAQYKALAQQRILSQTEILETPSYPSFDSNNNNLSTLPLPGSTTPLSTASAVSVVDVSGMSSKYYCPTASKPGIRNPQDQGNKDHTIDYDPINSIKANPQSVFRLQQQQLQNLQQQQQQQQYHQQNQRLQQ
ncbi:hypothetical protein BGZ97_006028 [Linnemannia gamsii]|uniref:Galactose oxidase n=1 Tax=Linnemannia gamsii TaxID=64522 RepID=A0A9P6QQ58_9FUNG|nr:hypothetical protein BGZ97_006028 [Linnemannia gamsii]